MLVLSYVFYGWVGWGYCLLLLGTTTIAFLGGIAVVHSNTEKSRRVAMALACAGLLALLGWFKYYGFVSVNVDNLTHVLGLRSRRAAPAGGAAHRHLVLHVHGVELCHRHLPPSAPAGASVGLGALPVVLPPSARRSDRARRRAVAPTAPAPGSDGRRLLARLVVDHGRALQEGRDLLVCLERHCGAGLHGSGAALCAGGGLRCVGLRGADLLRLQRLHRHRHRPGAPPRDSLPDQLRRALHGAQLCRTSGAAGTSPSRAGCATTSTSRSAGAAARRPRRSATS